MSALYLILNLLTVSFPLVRSFEPKINYSSKWKALFPAILITAVFFIAWDVVFTKNGVWGFNPMYLTGIYFFGLPLEEWLFFFTVPFASVFIYECVIYFLPKVSTSQSLRIGSIIISIVIVFIGLLNAGRAYTFWNFLFGGLFLGVISIINPGWFGKFWVTYLLHLIPFVLVNGVLTGSFIPEQIVWYNNEENLSIRFFTIPIEDSVYSLLLLLMNVTLFEYFKNKITT